MGQEASTPVDESTPPLTLKSRTVESVAEYIKDGRAKRIVVLTGAGISTSAGIPDFRSPDTGLYANLARLNLPYAEAVFDISYFRNNPLPFYALAHELYPGKYRPTIAHSFVRLLSDKALLLKLFTQNIDCLEREAGVPGEKIVEAHGSFARQSCIECKTPYPEDLMRRAIQNKEVPHCMTPQCNGLVKPEIVFFGEQLPEEFHRNRALPGAADLCIVMGTSLSVQPFASLPGFCADGTPRLLINLERVGGLGSRSDDVLLLGDCDAGVRRFASALGWLEELEALWEETNPVEDQQEQHQQKQQQQLPSKTKDEALEDEVDKLTAEVDKTLEISTKHHSWLKENLTENQGKGLQLDNRPEEKGPSSSVSAELDGKSKSISSHIERNEGTASHEVNGINQRERGSSNEGGLDHIFPHLEKESSL
ncbi:MAG: Sir2 histone deacetylase Hst2 [Pleopsidium flavum]|nr:MAG: Sir2 histone deacetylase Hst2 [Pleopsidium flavum]